VSAEINNGGPAFPMAGSTREWDDVKKQWKPQEGMTLRDWFAGQATEEDIEAHTGGDIHPQTGRLYNQMTREQAKYAYADAMIAAREAKP
jgi:hypothetical protein